MIENVDNKMIENVDNKLIELEKTFEQTFNT